MNHIHGGDYLFYLKKFNIKQKEITDFSVNVNPFGVPPALKLNWHKLIEYAGKYPSQDAEGVLEFYEERFGVGSNNIVAGNGSVELIYLAPMALDIKSVVIFEPSFYDYKRAFKIHGCKIDTIALKEKNGFEFVFDETFEKKMRCCNAVFLARPNNPTGNLIDKSEIINLAKRFSDKWFFIDEAFIQFTDDFENETLMNCRIENIVVFHSLTKFYALPGLRVGAAISSKETVKKFRLVKQPWSVNAIAEQAASMLVRCAEFEKASKSFVKTEKFKVKEALSNQKGLKVFDSSSNFFLAKWIEDINLDDFLKYLLENGVFVRDCRNFEGLEGDFFRFAVLSSKDNDRLIRLILNYA